MTGRPHPRAETADAVNFENDITPGVSQGGLGAPASIDPFGRCIDYMRISVTDRCNERCLYCLPEGFKGWRQRAEILTDDEVVACAGVFAREGVTKLRITGGEPLVREGIAELIARLTALRGIDTLSISTNGLLLAPLADRLARAGARAVNVSLDALTPATYARITGGRVERVLEGIRAARAAGLRVKLNCVLMRGLNETEIFPLIEYAAINDCLLRFIELMPVSRSDVLTEKNFLPAGEVMRSIAARTPMESDERRHGDGPATYRRLPVFGSSVGFIGAITNLSFCAGCNKMRMTADGKLRPCLGHHDETDLMPALRPSISPNSIAEIFRAALRRKPEAHAFRENYRPDRPMTAIGG